MDQAVRQAGHPFAEVRFEAVPEEGTIESVRFVVNEGPRTRLRKVSVLPEGPGAEAVERSELQSYFDFPAEGILGSGDVLYRRAQVESAVGEVERAFLLKGYVDVEAGPIDVQFNEERTAADVVVPVQTGPRYTLRVEPPKGIPDGVDLEQFKRDKWHKKEYTLRTPAEMAAALRRDLRNDGYQLAEVTPEYDPPGDGETVVEVRLRVEAGPKLALSTIEVENEGGRTAPDFIKGLFRLSPGDILKEEDLLMGRERLYATGLFSRVQLELTPDEEGGKDGTRPASLHVAVAELEARSVDLELGFGSYELLRAGVRYRDRNLFGGARGFDAALRGSLKSGQFELGYTDPYTFGLSNIFTARGGAEFRVEPSFTRQSLYGTLALQHELSTKTTLTGGYRFRYSEVSDVSVTEETEEGDSTEAGVFLGLRYDGRDNPIIPESGILAGVGTFWSTPALLADLHFLETSANLTAFIRLSEKREEGAATVLALSGRFITRDPLGDTFDLPIQDRLFLGGESSIRSFGESEVGPSEDGDPLGGLTAAEAHVELRQHLVGDLYAGLFYDVGVVNEEPYDLSGPFGHAIGVGLRYYLPVGPARLDFAWNPGERFAADQSWAIHFSFGFSF
jgi:outer membrane protein assembly factor BamA